MINRMTVVTGLNSIIFLLLFPFILQLCCFSPVSTTAYVIGFSTFSTSTVRTSSCTSSSSFRTTTPTTTTIRRHMVHDIRDADFGELIAGGQRYEMVPLPDSMVPTTVFVGNLCEFCNDDDLCRIFQSVSRLQSVPAIVARKPNMNSLRYGFVSFPTVEEKEKAILRFHGFEFMGRKLKVEEIRDDDRMGRVRVPEKIVAYVVGEAKRHSGAKKNRRATNTLRRIARLEESIGTKYSKSSSSSKSKKRPGDATIESSGSKRPTDSDVQTRPRSFKAPPQFTLTASEQEEMERAIRRGYISLEGSATKGYTRRRCGQSRLAAAHRQWCDERGLPHIVHCKANDQNGKFGSSGATAGGDGGGNGSALLDYVIVDLSPLRIHTDGGGATSDDFDVNDFLVRWKAEIATAAAISGMELRKQNFKQENYEMLSALDEDDEDFMENVIDNDNDVDDDECHLLANDSCEDYDEESTIKQPPDGDSDDSLEFVLELSDEDSWSTEPISTLPFLSMGIFEGERSQAKAMAKELAQLWGTTDSSIMDNDDDNDELDDLMDPCYQSNQFEPALCSTHMQSRNNNNRNSNGPSKKHRRSENRRKRRKFNSRDIDLHMF